MALRQRRGARAVVELLAEPADQRWAGLVLDHRRRLEAAPPSGLDQPPDEVDVLAEPSDSSNPPTARRPQSRQTIAAAGTYDTRLPAATRAALRAEVERAVRASNPSTTPDRHPARCSTRGATRATRSSAKWPSSGSSQPVGHLDVGVDEGDERRGDRRRARRCAPRPGPPLRGRRITVAAGDLDRIGAGVVDDDHARCARRGASVRRSGRRPSPLGSRPVGPGGSRRHRSAGRSTRRAGPAASSPAPGRRPPVGRRPSGGTAAAASHRG